MKKLQSGNSEVFFVSRADKMPDLGGMPEGVAACLYAPDMPEQLKSEIVRVISKKYRIKEEKSEDVRLRIIVTDDNFENRKSFRIFPKKLPTAYFFAGSDILSVLCTLHRKNIGAQVVVCDFLPESDMLAASVYGSVAAKLLALADYRIDCVLAGKKYDEAGAKRLRGEIVSIIRRGEKPDMYPLAEKAASIDGFFAEESCDVAFARVMNLISERDGHEKLPSGLVKLVAANVLSDVYRQFLLSDFGFIPPPDNNARLEQWSDYTGLDEKCVLSHMRRDFSESEITKAVYSIKTSRVELLAELCYDKIAFKCAMQKIKKLLPENGYSAFSRLNSDDIRISFALAPDLGGGKMYSLMKSMGLIDAFL